MHNITYVDEWTACRHLSPGSLSVISGSHCPSLDNTLTADFPPSMKLVWILFWDNQTLFWSRYSKLSWKFKVKVMAKGSHSRPKVQSICLFFVLWQLDHFWPKHSKFHIWPWKFKVRVMAKVKPDGPIWGITWKLKVKVWGPLILPEMKKNKKSCSKVITWTKVHGWWWRHTNWYKNIKWPPVYRGDFLTTLPLKHPMTPRLCLPYKVPGYLYRSCKNNRQCQGWF